MRALMLRTVPSAPATATPSASSSSTRRKRRSLSASVRRLVRRDCVSRAFSTKMATWLPLARMPVMTRRAASSVLRLLPPHTSCQKPTR